MILFSGTTELLRNEVRAVEGVTLEKLQVIIEAQTKAYYQELQKVQNQTRQATNGVTKQVDKIKSAFSKIGRTVAIALSVTAIVNFGRACIELGSNLSEVQNVVDVTFGNMSGVIDEFARNAIEQFGLSETSAKQYASTMGAMLKSMGFTTDAAAEMSMEIAGLAGDMASFYNLDGDDAFAKIRSGISGETEPLKQLGINLSVANLEQYALTQGITESYNAMTQQEQALLRYNYLLSVTSDAQGDFARTSDGWANQTRILSERFNSLKATIGQGLINVFTPVLKVINQVIQRLQVAADAFSKFTSLIMGTGSKASSVGSAAADAQTATDAMGSLESATADAGTSAKKAAEEYHGLAGFDEIHSLAKESDTSGGSGSSEDTAAIGIADAITTASDEAETGLNPVLDQVIEKLKEVKDLFSDGFQNGLGNVSFDPVRNAIDGIRESLMNIFTDSGVVSAADGYINAMAYSMGQQVGAIASVGTTIATNLIGGIDLYMGQNIDRIKEFLISMFDIGSEMETIHGNFVTALANIFSAFGGENGQQVTANIIGMFSDAVMGTIEIVGKAGRDIYDLFTRPFVDNQEGFRAALDGFLGTFAEVTGSIKAMIDEAFGKANEIYDASIGPLFDAIATGLSDTVGKALEFWNSNMQPLLDTIGEQFEALRSEHLQPLFDKALDLFGSVAEALTALWNNILKPLIDWIIENVLPVLVPIFETIISTITSVFGAIADILGGIIQAIQGVIDFVVGIFTGDWEKAWNGIKDIVTGIFNAIKAAIEYVMNLISGIISTVLMTISAIFSTVFNAIKSVVTTVFNAISTVIKTVVTGIKTAISTALNAISTIWSNIWNGMKDTVTSIFDGIWGAIKGVINSILGGIESMCNGVVNGINMVISALNTLHFDIPDWIPGLGGKTFGFNIPTLSAVSLPRLATGGIVESATPLIAGEAGKEAILPLESNTGWMDSLGARIGEIISVNIQGMIDEIGNGYQNIKTVVQLDSKVLVEQTDQYRKRKGYELRPT